MEFGDEGHRKGYCLYKLGCKGPETYANCPTIGFGDVGEGHWPVGCGHPCIGCTEKGVGFTKPIHALAKVKNVAPPLQYPRIVEEQGKGAAFAAAARCWPRSPVPRPAPPAMSTKNLGQATTAEAPRSQKAKEQRAES